MEKKKPLFPRKQLALLLCILISLLLCLVIKLLPDKSRQVRPVTQAENAVVSVSATGPATASAGREQPQPTREQPPESPRSAVEVERKSVRSTARNGTTGAGTAGATADAGDGAASRTVPFRTASRTAPRNTAASHNYTRGSEGRARLVIVIDDVGQNLQDLAAFIRLPAPLTFSVLPHLSYSREAAARIRLAGKEVILHMPMEPLGGENPGPGALYASASEQQIISLLDDAFNSVPGVRGFNNHMGSRVTAEPEAMRAIMRYARAGNKFFLDSKTTNGSVAGAAAGEYNVPFFTRALFLDNDPQAEAIRQQFSKVLTYLAGEAGKKATATRPYIAIGHIHNQDLALVIGEMLTAFSQAGIDLARLDEFCDF